VATSYEHAVLALHYFPSAEWFNCLLQCEKVLIEQHETYQKRSGRNRCRLMGANGPFTLSIPLQQGKTQQAYREVKISYQMPWQNQHWRSIASAYGKSPFFEHYADAFEQLYSEQIPYLFDWNLRCLETIYNCLDLQKQYQLTDIYLHEYPESRDFRNLLLNDSLPGFSIQAYPQVFSHKFPFDGQLSMLDLLFCMGPDFEHYL